MREPPGRRTIPYARRLLRRALVLAATVLVLTVIGPFGTFADLGWGGRLAYWGGLMVAGWIVFEGLSQGLVARARRRAADWRLALAVAGVGAAAVLTLVVALVERSVRGNDFLHPWGLAELFVYVAVLTLLVSAPPVWMELRDRGVAPPPDGDAPGAPPPSRALFLDRLPPRLGRDLLALTMEDHYVRVHTSAGSDLVLMRLRDAVAELAGVEGLQVHRSHWVAAAAVTAVERDRHGKMTLVLRNSLRVPVSCTYAAAVRAAGWG